MIGENQAILARRWPEVLDWLESTPELRLEVVDDAPAPALRVDGIQLASAWTPADEARMQGALVPAGTASATVYGLAQGNLPRLLLARPGLLSLRVVLLSRAAALAAFTYVELYDWLDDPRVELVIADEATELERPFAAAPASLRLADEQAWRLRDLVVQELATPYVRRHLDAQADQVASNIAANRPLLELDDDVARYFGTQVGKTVRVAAAGPTLSDHYARLAEGDAPLIAVDAALRPLLDAGIVPDFVVSIEKLEWALQRLMGVSEEEVRDCALVYFPSSPHALLTSWPGPRITAYGASDAFAELREEAPRGVLWSSGSVVHPAIDLAVQMGAGRVELYGADFATPRGRSHVEGMSFVVDVATEPNTPTVLDGHGEHVASMPNLVGYLRDLEAYVTRHPEVDFVNTSREGARIRGVRYPEESHAA